MCRNRVLVLDGHSRAAVECVQALGRCGAVVDVVCRSTTDLAGLSAYVRTRFPGLADPAPEPFVEWLRRCDETAQYDLVVPTTEIALRAARKLAEGDPLRKKMVIPQSWALDVALDKSRTAELALNLGICVPRSRLITAGARVDGPRDFPVVLKPVSSKFLVSGELVTLEPAIVRDAGTWLRWTAKWLPHTPVLEQEYVSGAGVGVEALYDHGRMEWFFAHERLHEFPLTGGASTYRRSVWPAPDLLDSARRLLDSLGWHGVAMVEFKRTASGEFVLMEINPRLWGSLALSIDAGVDFPAGLLRIATGHPVGTQPQYRIGFTTRNPSSDFLWMLDNLRADRRDPLLLTRPVARSVIEWLRPLTGRESWDHFDIKDWRITWRLMTMPAGHLGRWLRRRCSRRITLLALRRAHRRTMRQMSRCHPPRRLLFLCYGNICRSPFAQRLAEKLLPGMIVESAGFYPVASRPSPSSIRSVALDFGVDLSAHRSAVVSPQLLGSADVVILMDAANFELLIERFPNMAGRVLMLGGFSPKPKLEIEDPYGQDQAAIQRIFSAVQSGVEGLANWVRKLG